LTTHDRANNRQDRHPEEDIEPGMAVETREGDLGEEGVSKPTVKEIVRHQEGKVNKVVVQKGIEPVEKRL
jgi:hypothetical protein